MKKTLKLFKFYTAKIKWILVNALKRKLKNVIRYNLLKKHERIEKNLLQSLFKNGSIKKQGDQHRPCFLT